jgi:hypothetical protein
MDKKWTTSFIEHYNVWLQVVKTLVNGFEFFWKWRFCKSFNINLNKIVWFFILFLKKSSKRLYQEHFQKSSQNQACVVHVIPFAHVVSLQVSILRNILH